MCAWPGCSQLPQPQEPLCYYHAKVSTGLIDGRDEIPFGPAQRKRQDDLVWALIEVGASEAVVAANSALKQQERTSRNGGGSIPSGRIIR